MSFEGWYMRVATPDDAAELLAIYEPYVRDTVISFEVHVPSLQDFRGRIEKTLQRYPYLVACAADGTILGYCYAGPFKMRSAYDWSVETTVYFKPEAQGNGMSGALYAWLEEILIQQRITNMCACIAYPNPPSMRFHARRGFAKVAHFTKCGYKLGTWQDMIWMEKHIATHPEHPLPIISFSELPVASPRLPA